MGPRSPSTGDAATCPRTGTREGAEQGKARPVLWGPFQERQASRPLLDSPGLVFLQSGGWGSRSCVPLCPGPGAQGPDLQHEQTGDSTPGAVWSRDPALEVLGPGMSRALLTPRTPPTSLPALPPDSGDMADTHPENQKCTTRSQRALLLFSSFSLKN